MRIRDPYPGMKCLTLSGYPSKHGDTDRDGQEDDESYVAEPVVEVDGETGQKTDEEREDFPRPHERRHREHGDDERRVRADEVGQLQTIVVEDTKRVELLIARMVELWAGK